MAETDQNIGMWRAGYCGVAGNLSWGDWGPDDQHRDLNMQLQKAEAMNEPPSGLKVYPSRLSRCHVMVASRSLYESEASSRVYVGVFG